MAPVRINNTAETAGKLVPKYFFRRKIPVPWKTKLQPIKNTVQHPKIIFYIPRFKPKHEGKSIANT